jgi:hypothetical protein
VFADGNVVSQVKVDDVYVKCMHVTSLLLDIFQMIQFVALVTFGLDQTANANCISFLLKVADLSARRSREIDFVVNNMNALKRELFEIGDSIHVQAAVDLMASHHSMWLLRIRSILAESLYACIVRKVVLIVIICDIDVSS